MSWFATLASTTRPSLCGTSFISVSCAATACPAAVTTISCTMPGVGAVTTSPLQDGILRAQLLSRRSRSAVAVASSDSTSERRSVA